MSILIIGANGQVGRHCVEEAQQRSIAYTTTTRAQLDLSKTQSIGPYIRQLSPSAVINCAAYTAVDKAETEPELAHTINTMAPEAMALACQFLDIPLLHISTDYVFSGDKIGAYTESDKTGPINVYGKTKLAGELSIQKNCRRYYILRTSWVFSEYGNNFVKTMLKLAESKKALSIVNDQWGCPTYAGTIATTLFELLTMERQEHNDYGVYHFCNQGKTNWCKFSQEIFQQATHLKTRIKNSPSVTGIPGKSYPTPAPRPANSVLSTTKLQYLLQKNINHWHDTLTIVLQKIK